MEEAVAYQLVEPSRPGRSMRACCGGEAGVVVAAYSLLSFCIAGSALFFYLFLRRASSLELVRVAGAGALQVVNVGYNAEVAAVVGSPIVASALTPPVALASLLCADPFFGRGDAAGCSWREGAKGVPLKVQYLGGALGAAAVLCTTTAAAPLGAVRMHTVMVATELVATLALDHCAPLGRTMHALSPRRALGAAVAAGGVVLSTAGATEAGGAAAAGVALFGYLAVAGLNGVFLPVQVTLNTSLAKPFKSWLRPAVLSMASATVVLAIAAAVLFAASPPARRRALDGLPRVDLYLYTSGILAALWVGISVVACKRVSLATFFILNTLGRCAASIVVDATGTLGFPKIGVDAFAVSGLALACVGAFILQKGSKPAVDPNAEKMAVQLELPSPAPPSGDAALSAPRGAALA